MSQPPPADDPSFVSDTCETLRKYRWTDSTLIAVLFPQGGDDKFVSKKRQNKLPFCTFLRQRLDRASYTWSKHPDCSQYQYDYGCIITRPIMVSGYNQSHPYPNILAFLQNYRDIQSGVAADDAQRWSVYGLLNNAIGGPHGKVR